MAQIVGGGTPSTVIPEYWNGTVNWFAPAEMEGVRYAVESTKKITELGLTKSSARLLPPNRTVLFTSRAGIGKMAILCCHAATNQGFQSMVLSEENNPYFVYSMQDIIKTKAENVASGSTFLEISGKTLGNLILTVPQKLEQDQIATFFQHIDDLITLHQREFFCKKWRIKSIFASQKRAITWEQREYGDCFDERQERSAEGELISVTMSEGIKKFSELNRHDNSSEDKSHYKKVEIGDIAYNSMRMWQGASGYSPFSGILSPAYTVLVPKEGTCSRFFSYLMKRPTVIHLFKMNSQGITSDTWNLKYPELSELPCVVPKEDEQEDIARIFIQIDSLITLHQCKYFIDSNEQRYTLREANTQKRTNTWEQRKVMEIADRYDNLRIPVAAALRIKGTTPYYGANGIQDYVEGYTHDGEFVLVAEDGANDLKNYPVKCVKGRIWVNNHAHVIQGKPKKTDNRYLSYSLHRADIESLLVGGGRAKLTAVVLMNIELYLPKTNEQQKIGQLMEFIDNLITLHQCKELEKRRLEVKHEKNRNNRNSHYTWEQRKLSYYLMVSDEKNTENKYGKENVLSVSGDHGIVNQIEFQGRSFAGASVSNYGVVHYGDVVYTKSPLNSNPFGIIKTNKGETGIVSTLYAIYHVQKTAYPFFIQQYFNQNSRVNNYLHPLVNKGAKNDMKVSAANAIDGDVIFPQFEEQVEITRLLERLDNLITLHQRGNKYI